MSRPVAAPGKRKRPGQDPAALSSDEQIVLDLIVSKKDSGITDKEAKWQIKTIPMPSVTKAIKSLKAANLIKEVKSHGGKKIIMGANFTPSVQISGGIWYNEGKMDDVYVDELKKACSGYLKKNKVATLEAIQKFVDNGVSTEPVPQAQLAMLLEMMVLSNEVIEVKSTGLGEFSRIRVGETCYKLSNAAGKGDASTPITGAFASIPCGMCPRRDMCTPDGVISPTTCVYFTKWFDIKELDF